MQHCFSFILQVLDTNGNMTNNHTQNYTMEHIIPRGTKEIPINMGPPGKKSYRGIMHIYKTKNSDIITHSKTLVILNIHASIPVKTIVAYLYPYWHVIEHIRVIKSEKINRYSALLRFKTNDDACLCFQMLDGCTIHDEEHTMLNLAFVHSVEITSKNNFPIPKNSVELPSCPVCLEKLDETVNGLMTIQCDHTFHRECIYRWSDINCPVCRLEQSPLNTGEQRCEKCGSTDSLWICLICGFVGCDRYQNKHAVMHFEETCHTFSKQIGGAKVWDYISDCYVHRIISNETDNKLIEWETIPKATDNFNNERSIDFKLSHMEKEYLSLISIQLENQKDYFQRRIDQQTKNHSDMIKQLETNHKHELTLIESNLNNNIAQIQKQFTTKIHTYEQTIDKYKKEIELQNQKLTLLQNELKNVSSDNGAKLKNHEKTVITLKTKLKEALKHLEDEKLLNNNIDKNKQQYEEQLAIIKQQRKQSENNFKSQIEDLQSQIQDLTFHLETSAKLKTTAEQMNEDISTAKIEITTTPTRRNYKLKRQSQNKNN